MIEFRNRLFEFSIEIIKLNKELITNEKEYVISNQIIKSATSIGANYEESQAASSRKDFLNKVHISYKETFETRYWLKILERTNRLNNKYLLNEIEEIIKIFSAIIRSTSKKL